MDMKRLLLGLGLSTAMMGGALGADLGKGNDYADLEERIAELEATTAKKGNRKVSLTISGEVSKAILWHNIDGLPGANKLRVIDNPNSGTKVRLAGEAKISPNLKAGFIFEYGFDETRGDALGPVGSFLISDAELRKSAAWVETAFGRVTVGKFSLATDNIAAIDLSNANVASRMMSFEPIWSYLGVGAIVGPVINPAPFTDLRANVVRYDSPELAGFRLSGSWGGGQTASGDDLWDVALTYGTEVSGVRVMAGAGYRVEQFKALGLSDQKTMSASGSAKHMASGLFVSLGYGDVQDHPMFGDLRMMQARAGIERKFIDAGQTTLFAEIAEHKLTTLSAKTHVYGLGVVQNVEGAALDLFIDWRKTEGDVIEYSTILGGARIRF